MRISLESTTKMVELETCSGCRVAARIWEGKTASGIPVHAYITRIAVLESQDQHEFERELKAHRAPSAAIDAIPLRLIL
jgi:hypothetical protein